MLERSADPTAGPAGHRASSRRNIPDILGCHRRRPPVPDRVESDAAAQNELFFPCRRHPGTPPRIIVVADVAGHDPKAGWRARNHHRERHVAKIVDDGTACMFAGRFRGRHRRGLHTARFSISLSWEHSFNSCRDLTGPRSGARTFSAIR